MKQRGAKPSSREGESNARLDSFGPKWHVRTPRYAPSLVRQFWAVYSDLVYLFKRTTICPIGYPSVFDTPRSTS
jgi:hypothetical protein